MEEWGGGIIVLGQPGLVWVCPYCNSWFWPFPHFWIWIHLHMFAPLYGLWLVLLDLPNNYQAKYLHLHPVSTFSHRLCSCVAFLCMYIQYNKFYGFLLPPKSMPIIGLLILNLYLAPSVLSIGFGSTSNSSVVHAWLAIQIYTYYNGIYRNVSNL